ncbi:MAG: HAD-IA family hydrolase [Nevskiales bacterium]
MGRKYDLIVFDWDGTLMDSAGHIVAAMQHAIRGLGLPVRSDTQLSELIGLGLNDAFARLYPELNTAATLKLLSQYRQHFLNPPVPEAVLFSGVQETLQQLHAAGYRMAVATGKSRRGLDRALDETGLKPLFVASRCADECASKPDPQMLNEILWECAVEPARALMVGDTEYDMAMARNADVIALGVACGVHEPARLRAGGASVVLSAVPGLLTWLSDVPV